MIDLNDLRAALQSRWIERPDDSHGQGYINSGLASAIAAVNELASDIDRYAQCSPRTKDYGLEWCSVHHGPYEQTEWACRFAAAPWTWKDQVA